MNLLLAWADQQPGKIAEDRMTSFFQWIGLAIAAGLVGLGVFAFFRGLSLPPNTPEHRAHGKDDTWRI
jgi:hypothetical protein